jgi:hypothetical protein
MSVIASIYRISQFQKCDIADKAIAIPSLFGKPSYPTIPLEPLQREQSLRSIEKSGWRDSNPKLL